MSATRLMVLGVLAERPMHGYDVKGTLRSWGAEWWAGVTDGSIYSALKTMERDGLLEIERTERAGTRPERTVYAVTGRGRDEFLRLLREAWWQYQPVQHPLAVAATFAGHLPKEEVDAALRARAAGLRAALEQEPYVVAHKREVAGDAAASAAQLGYVIARAELEWIDTLLDEPSPSARRTGRAKRRQAPPRS